MAKRTEKEQEVENMRELGDQEEYEAEENQIEPVQIEQQVTEKKREEQPEMNIHDLWTCLKENINKSMEEDMKEVKEDNDKRHQRTKKMDGNNEK